MSASLNTLAAQFTAASQALTVSSGAIIPESDVEVEEPREGLDEESGRESAPNLTVSKTIRSGQETLLVLKRLEAIEKTQSHLLSKIASLEGSHTSGTTPHIENPKQAESKNGLEIEEIPTAPGDKEKEKREEAININQDLGSLLKNLISRLEGIESRMEGLEGKVNTVSEAVRLE